MTAKTTPRNWTWELAALSLALAGVAARCLPWRYVFSAGDVVLTGTDSYYHLWRARMLVESFPLFPSFDPFLSFPAGAAVPWPPGFDLLVALPGLLGGGDAAMAGWGTFLMALLGGASVYLVYRLGRRLSGPAVGLAAAGFLCLMGGAIEYSSVGRVDHHALVAPVCLGIFLAALASRRTGSRPGCIGWGCLCGLLAAVSVGSWVITPPVYFIPVPVTFFFLHFGDRNPNARRAAWWCLGSAAVLVFFAVLLAGDLEARPFDLYHPSWFSVALFGFAAAFVLPGFHRRLAWPLMAAVALAAGCLLILVPGLLDPLREGMRVATGADPSYKMGVEASGLLSDLGRFSFDPAVSQYSYLILLAPLLWGVFFYRTFKSKDLGPEPVLFLAFSFMGIGLLLIQRRFGEFAAPALALLFGWALVEGGRRFMAFFKEAPGRARAVVWAVGLLAALGAALSPLAKGIADRVRYDPVAYQRHLLAFAGDLRRQMPAATRPDGGPAWGVIAGWNESLPLLYKTGRPVMVGSFGTREALAANRIAFGILLDRDEERAYREMVEHRIRFVVTSSLLTQIVAMAEMAGYSEPYVTVEIKEQDGRRFKQFTPLPLFAECLYARMALGDGSERTVIGRRHPPLVHLRLTMESDTRYSFAGTSVALYKVFEAVPGARLTGTAEPAQRVLLRLSLQTNTGRQFLYESQTTAAPDGRFEMVVPYPTDPWGAAVTPRGLYRVKIGDNVHRIEVSEADVLEGRWVSVF